MRVAGNKLKHLQDFFHAELQGQYESLEIDAMFGIAAGQVLGYSRSELALKKEENVNQSDLLKIYDQGKALKQGIPLQYVLGETEFYGLTFKVNSSVLIPRPETEELVDHIIRHHPSAQSLMDIGTGSGCIPVTLKKRLPQSTVYACDISDKALETANENAALNKVLVQFFKADVLQDTSMEMIENGSMDILVSNPPYIKNSERTEMAAHVLEHEPHLALFVEGNDPIIFYKKITDLATFKLKQGGSLYFELNPLTAEDVKRYVSESGKFSSVELLIDMSGHVRFLKARKL